MSANEKFCLRWNDFESNISGAFREIREEKDFFDCTLSCGDRQIQAHKLILSACSPFFRSILRQNPHQHPLLYLKGVEFTDLQAVLNFMYHGEVNVAQEELNSFLSVAEELQVKGLTQNNSSAQPKQEPTKVTKAPRSHPEPEALPLLKHTRPTPQIQPTYQHHQEGVHGIQEVLPSVPLQAVKTEPQPAYVGQLDMVETLGMEVANTDDSYVEEGYDDYGEYEAQGYDEAAGHVKGLNPLFPDQPEGQEGINDNIVDDPHGLGFTCGLCGKGFGANKHHCRRHIKNFHNLATSVLSCPVCQKSYKNNDSLKNHMRLSHGFYKKS